MAKNIDFCAQNIRAIESACLALDGITIVAGINGSGKSTLSRLLYYIFLNTNGFEKIVLDLFNKRIRQYVSVVEQMTRYIMHSGTMSRRMRRMELQDLAEFESFYQRLKVICDEFLASSDAMAKKRLSAILASALNKNAKEELEDLVNLLCQRIIEQFKKAENQIEQRPYKILNDSIEEDFGESLKGHVTMHEYGTEVIGDSIKEAQILHYISKVAYIDTPMCLGANFFDSLYSYRDDLNDLLKKPVKRGYNLTINKILSKEIMHGEVRYDENDFGVFKYKTEDGNTYDLQECATGIKSFAILQMLLRSRFLDENTLLILDEPEAHLHPQWIVEYARLIVLLHKKVGVKFFVASHSTDFVSAIRHISKKEKCANSVSFYLATEATNGKYIYNPLGTDIEPIFESFNKSFAKIDLYSGNNAE